MNNQNNFIYGFTYFPPVISGGESENNRKENNLIGGKSMNEILEKYETFLGVKYRKANSKTRYLNAAQKFLAHAENITGEEIQQYLIFLNQTQKPNTVTSNIVGLNRFLKYLQRPDLRVSTPSWKQITRDTINREQIIRLIQHVKEHHHYMDYLILLMVRDLDCRNHEITRTRWDWIHGDKILFKDCKTGDTIGRLTPELQQALAHWKEITPVPDKPYVFCVLNGRYKGQQLSEKGWYIRDLVNQVSIEVIGRRLNPQDLRASVITAEYTSYVNPKIIQLKARHSSEKTTQRYNHASEEMVAEYIENGTIFSENIGSVSLAKPGFGKNKRGYINTILCTPTLSDTEDDNTSLSFSYSFFDSSFDECIDCANMEATWVVLFSFFLFLPNMLNPRPLSSITTIFHQGSIPCSGEASHHVTRRAIPLSDVKDAGIINNEQTKNMEIKNT